MTALRRADGAPSLHHVALGTADVAGLSQFYCQLLGTTELRRQLDDAQRLRSVWIDLSGTILMIERAEAPRPSRQASGLGAGEVLLAFHSTSAQRGELEARAAELGCSIEYRSQHSSYFRDPDGNRLALSEYELTT